MSKSKPENPVEETKRGSSRVIRGGDWYYDPDYVRSSYRSYDPPSTRYNDYGFRIARTVKK